MAKIYGQLEAAQHENLAADPASTATGYVYFNTVSLFMKHYNGAAWKTLVETNSTQILTLKDIDGGTATNTSRITLPSGNSAALAALTRKAGTLLYDTDKTKPYYDNGSTLKPVGSGGSGSGINYVLDPSAEDDLTGWVASGAGVTVTRETTAANLPRESLTPTAIKITCVSGTTDYVHYRFQLGDADKAKQLMVSWAQKALSGYAAGDLVLEMWSNSASNYGGTYTQLSVLNPNLADGDYVMETVWSATTADYYELRVRIAAGTGALALSDITVGPQIPVSTVNVTDWQSYAIALTGGGAITTSGLQGRWRQVGDSIEVQFYAAFSSNGTGGQTLGFSLPNGYTRAASKIPLDAGGNSSFGIFDHYIGTSHNVGFVTAYDGDSNSVALIQDQLNAFLLFSSINNGDLLHGTYIVPVNELNSQIFSAQTAVEYAFNTDTSNASSATGFGYGQGGQQFGNFTASLTKRVRFKTSIQPTDDIEWQASLDFGATWFNIAGASINFGNYVNNNGTEYGIALNIVNSTDVDVAYAQYRAVGSAAFGGAGQTWAGIAGNSQYLWRVRKSSNPLGIGHDLVGQNKSGLVASAGQLRGTNTTDEGNDGSVGQFLTDTVAGYVIATTNTYFTPISVDFAGLQPGEFEACLNSTFFQNSATWSGSSNFLSGLSYAANSFPDQQFGLTATFDSADVNATTDYASSSLSGVRIFWDGTNITIHNIAGTGSILYGVAYAHNFTAGNPLAYLNLNVRRVR